MHKGYLIAASAIFTVAIETNPLPALAQSSPNQAAVNNEIGRAHV